MLDELVKKVTKWADDRGILHEMTPMHQTVKLLEEVSELAAAVVSEDKRAIIDGIGDCMVVLTNLAAMQGLDLSLCYHAAWLEIKNRQGRIVDGFFIKNTPE